MQERNYFIHQENLRDATSAFFTKAFEETKEQPLKYAKKTGKYFNLYNDLYVSHKDKLNDIDPSLPENVLFLAPIALPISLDEPTRRVQKIVDLRNSYSGELKALTDQLIVSDLKDQQFEADLLTEPTTFCSQKGRSCYLSTYRMVFTSITGVPTNEKTVISAARKNNLLINNNFGRIDPHSDEQLYTDVEDNTLLATLQTPSFRETYDTQVGIVKFAGADFKEVKSVVQKLNEKFEDKNISQFFIPSYASELVTNGWHNGLLLSADEKSVEIREPYPNHIRPKDRSFGKETFIRKWANAHLRGDLIFAVKDK